MNQNLEQFQKMIHLLEVGWEIVEPVRSQFVPQTRETMYHFRLRHLREGNTSMLIVPTSQTLQQFFVQNNIDTCDIAWQPMM